MFQSPSTQEMSPTVNLSDNTLFDGSSVHASMWLNVEQGQSDLNVERVKFQKKHGTATKDPPPVPRRQTAHDVF